HNLIIIYELQHISNHTITISRDRFQQFGYIRTIERLQIARVILCLIWIIMMYHITCLAIRKANNLRDWVINTVYNQLDLIIRLHTIKHKQNVIMSFFKCIIRIHIFIMKWTYNHLYIFFLYNVYLIFYCRLWIANYRRFS